MASRGWRTLGLAAISGSVKRPTARPSLAKGKSLGGRRPERLLAEINLQTCRRIG
jgi:hypothetical protein